MAVAGHVLGTVDSLLVVFVDYWLDKGVVVACLLWVAAIGVFGMVGSQGALEVSAPEAVPSGLVVPAVVGSRHPLVHVLEV